MDRFGRIDLLVNNAGVIQVGPLESMTLRDFEDALGIMFWGTVYPTLAVLPQMRARGSGRIVNITSIGGKIPVPQLTPYVSAKFAAVGFSESLRAEVARDGIAVTTVVPGLMRTGSALNAFFKGPGERMFGLFSPMASWPIISMDAERAARRIVQAVKRGESEIILSLPANLAVRFHGLFPGLTTDLAGLANHLLPRADGPETSAERGMELYRRLSNPILDRAIGWTLSAARRFNQHPGPLDAPGLGRHASRSERA
jgi:short-subunit dehydrogenase